MDVDEMAQVSPEVYDIIHSTPVSLKELSAITVCLEIWRREMNKARQTGLLKCFGFGQKDHLSLHIPWKACLPDLPSTIYDLINKYVIVLRNSLTRWPKTSVQYTSDSACWSEFLAKFDDFVCDYDGSVHFRRTAERILRCDEVSDDMKFRIACAYYLEDDIRRMWPVVSTNMDIDSIDFDRHPHVYYWSCRLSNKLDKISLTEGNVNIDEEMFDKYNWATVSSLEYFWKGVSVENQMQKAVHAYKYDQQIFVRIILPKLSDQQLKEFVNEHGPFLMLYLLRTYWNDERLVLRTWLYIRDVMNQSTFTKCVFLQGLLKDHYRRMADECYDGIDGVSVVTNNCYLQLCGEMWNNIPDNFKQSAIADFISGTELLEIFRNSPSAYGNEASQINVQMLLVILQCVSSTERNTFWRNCWHLLIGIARGEDLQRIMNLFFENNESEMAEFKQHTMAISETVRELCVELLREGKYFSYLNELLSFIWPEKQTANDFKQKILRECFLPDDDANCQFHYRIIRRSRKFNEFITGAYATVELSVDFKNQLMSSSSPFLNTLCSLIPVQPISVNGLLRFINAFVSTEEDVARIKMSIADSYKDYLTNRHLRHSNRDVFSTLDFNRILLWCLGSREEVEKFELACV